MNLQTKVHTYKYDLGKEKDREAYAAMCETIPGKRFACLAPEYKDRFKFEEGQTLELEAKWVFSDQWNTACGKRVMDWNDPVYPNANLRLGYWLEVTPEMRELRRNTLKCGFCGKHYQAAQGYEFCKACLDSPYLKQTELRLLRLKNCEQSFPEREPLTEAEADRLTPLYVERQTIGADSRAVKAKAATRRRVEEKYKKESEAAKDEHDGFIWLLDHDVNVENCIFYTHTGRFCFGWRGSIDPEVKSRLLDLLCEFPFDYDFKNG